MRIHSLRLFGSVGLTGPDGPLTGPAVQRHRLALLALLALARPRSVSRDKLMAWLWPDRDAEHARGLLNQAVHVLRRTLGPEAIRSAGDELQLDPDLVACDVTDFESAVATGDLDRAASVVVGPFLDGFFLSGSPEFEAWVAGERERLADGYARVLEALAERAGSRGDWPEAVEHRKRRASLDPLDSRAVGQLMLALEASGNRAAALLQLTAHERLLREELALELPRELVELAERLRSSPSGPVPTSFPPLGGPAASPAQAAPTQPIDAKRALRPIWLGSVGALLAIAAVVATTVVIRARRPIQPVTPPEAIDQIATAVARELARRERGDTAGSPPRARTQSIPAFELYLRGSDPAVLRSESGVHQAIGYFRRAVELDTGYAAAWAGLARLTLRATIAGTPASIDRAYREADSAASRAVRLDDSLAEAHATLGLVRMGQNDPAGAERELSRALALDPSQASYHEWLARIHLWLGRTSEAEAEATQALTANPLSPTASAELARVLLAAGRCDDALTRLERIAGLDPPLLRAAIISAQCHAKAGRFAEAIAELESLVRGGDLRALALRGLLLAHAGRVDEASRALETLLERVRQGESAAASVAVVYFGLGRRSEAASWLERTIEDRSLHAFAEPGPLLTEVIDSLRGDRRVATLRRKLGLE